MKISDQSVVKRLKSNKKIIDHRVEQLPPKKVYNTVTLRKSSKILPASGLKKEVDTLKVMPEFQIDEKLMKTTSSKILTQSSSGGLVSKLKLRIIAQNNKDIPDQPNTITKQPTQQFETLTIDTGVKSVLKKSTKIKKISRTNFVPLESPNSENRQKLVKFT